MQVPPLWLSDDAETPGGNPPIVLNPESVTQCRPWRVYSWPEPDVPVGTLIALQVPFPALAGQRFLANGWQSWSAPTVRRLGFPNSPAPLRGLSRRHLLRLTDTGDSSNDFLATADGVVGFTGGGGLLVADVKAGVVLAVRRHVGDPHPPVWVAHGDGPALVDDLLDRCGGRDPGRLPVGWSTWEAFGERIDADVLTRALRSVRTLAGLGLCELAVVDDGWQAAIGDWRMDARRFPPALAALASRVHDTGVSAGLWTAPLLVAPSAEIAHRRPEWIARRADGTPVVGADVGHWGGPMWVLDATRRDVLDHLTERAAEQVCAGFDLLKLDFLYAAADAADAATSRAQAGRHRAGDLLGADTVTAAVLDAIRAGAGHDVPLLGCGAPLWPSIGRVDMMRVGPDVTRWFRPRPDENSDPAMVSIWLNGRRSSTMRASMHRRLWGNDPDMVSLSRRTEVSDQNRFGWARSVAQSGQLLTLSDDFAEFSVLNLAQWERLVVQSRAVPARPVGRALAQVLGDPPSAAPRTSGPRTALRERPSPDRAPLGEEGCPKRRNATNPARPRLSAAPPVSARSPRGPGGR